MAISPRVTEIILPTGGRIAILPTNVKDVVTIEGSIMGGPSAVSLQQSVAAEMTASLLDTGAGKLSKEAFRASLASRGAGIAFDTSGARVVFSAHCFPEDIPFVLARITDALFAPALPSGELAPEKLRTATELDKVSANTQVQATLSLARLMYPSSHQHYPLTTKEEKRLASLITLPDLKAIAKNYGTKHLALAIVGDVRVKQVREAVEKCFGKTVSGFSRPHAAPITSLLRSEGKRETVIIPNKTSADVVLGNAVGFDAHDDRYLPASLAAYMLGGSFAGHLMQTVRDRDGLTYGVSASMRGFGDKLDGYFQLWGTFAPEFLMRGIDALQRETSIFFKQGLTEETLADGKTEVAGSYAVSLSTTSGLASQLLRILENDRPVSWIDEYPKRIGELTLEEVRDAADYLASLPLSIVTAGSLG